jgi:hypothetical protein
MFTLLHDFSPSLHGFGANAGANTISRWLDDPHKKAGCIKGEGGQIETEMQGENLSKTKFSASPLRTAHEFSVPLNSKNNQYSIVSPLRTAHELSETLNSKNNQYSIVLPACTIWQVENDPNLVSLHYVKYT